MGYKDFAIRGVSWITGLRIITRALTFVRLAILGRALTPVQFGYFSIASLFLSVLEIFTETGINVFLIQNKADIKQYINSAWVVSIFRGVILAILIFLSADLVANFFNSPESSHMIKLIALVPLVRGFINPAIVIYQKDLLFSKEFSLRTALFSVDVVISIVVGVLMQSAIGFVYGQLASAIVEVIASYYFFALRPKLVFEIEKVKKIITRGFWVTATGIFSYFADNSDSITVGKLLGSGPLGFYQVAYKVSTLPISEITMVVNQVIFPVYSKFSEDKPRLWKALLKVTTANTIAAILLGSFIFVFAAPIITILMGDQWSGAIPVVRVLAIYGILRTIFGSFGALFLSVGRQDYVAKMTLVRVLTLLILVIPFIQSYGLIGAGLAMLVSIIVEIPVILFFTAKLFR